MTPDEADHTLRGARTVPLFQGSMDYVKELRAQCLDAGLAAAIVRPPRRGGG